MPTHARTLAPLILVSCLAAIVACSGQPRTPVRSLVDLDTGERAIVAMWTEPSGGAVLEIWSDGTAAWTSGFRPPFESRAHGVLDRDEVGEILASLDASLSGYDDTPNDPSMTDTPCVTLAWGASGRQHRVTTFHTMAPTVDSVLTSRWSRMLVEDGDPSRRRELQARVDKVENGFVAAFDSAMATLEARLRAHEGRSGSVRRSVVREE